MIHAARKPLESALHADPTNPLSRSDNPSLLLDRHLRYGADGEPKYREASESLQSIARSTMVRTERVYRPAFERWRATFRDAERQTFETLGRVLVGFGGHHVLETGLTLHKTYGVPILPGTALKGLASHYCHQVWGAADHRFRRKGDKSEREGEFSRVLFGTTDEGGLVEFHDAWMLPESLATALADDVLTPHHGDYYLQGNVPPSDYDDPVPVRFLSVAGRFMAPITCSSPVEPDAWRALAQALLVEALFEAGVGGKTNIGYGRLKLATP